MSADSAFAFPTSPRERNDQAPLGPAPSYDQVLDVAVEYTFPASDPVAVESSAREAARREREQAAADSRTARQSGTLHNGV